jgi:hypothetical protein
MRSMRVDGMSLLGMFRAFKPALMVTSLVEFILENIEDRSTLHSHSV